MTPAAVELVANFWNRRTESPALPEAGVVVRTCVSDRS